MQQPFKELHRTGRIGYWTRSDVVLVDSTGIISTVSDSGIAGARWNPHANKMEWVLTSGTVKSTGASRQLPIPASSELETTLFHNGEWAFISRDLITGERRLRWRLSKGGNGLETLEIPEEMGDDLWITEWREHLLIGDTDLPFEVHIVENDRLKNWPPGGPLVESQGVPLGWFALRAVPIGDGLLFTFKEPSGPAQIRAIVDANGTVISMNPDTLPIIIVGSDSLGAALFAIRTTNRKEVVAFRWRCGEPCPLHSGG